MTTPTGLFRIKRLDRAVNDVRIESDGLTIGRLPGNELVLNHRGVDETHAGIKMIEGRYWISYTLTTPPVISGRSRRVRAGALAKRGIAHHARTAMGRSELKSVESPP